LAYPSAAPFLELITAKRSFLLSGHENPDGDCVGAQAALWHLLAALGKEVSILNPDPLGRQFAFLLEHTRFDSFRRGQPLPAAEVIVLLDCAELSRLGELGRALRGSAATIATIDHHVDSGRGDAHVAFVDSSAPATGALVHGLYSELGVPLSAAAAQGIFLSLVSDTGWFRYSNTDARVLELAAELVAAGVDASGLYDLLHRRNRRDSVELLVAGLARHGFALGDRLAYVCLDKALMDRAARAGFDTDAILDPLRSVEGVEVVALLKERADGEIKLSLRAKGEVDVQAIAASFGGGGHTKAAGATLSGTLPAALRAVEDRVRAALAAE
jgi:phosphoesterase RecJ-like protein